MERFMFLKNFRLLFVILAFSGNPAAIAQVLAASNEEAGGRVLPVDSQLCQNMKSHGVLTGRGPLTCERLRLVIFSYVDFNGTAKRDGRIVVLDAISQQVLDLFNELRF